MDDEVTSWSINPETLDLEGPAGPPEGYSARQFGAQVWPPCPVCGSAIEVNALAVQNPAQTELTFLPGHWQCRTDPTHGSAPAGV